MSGNEAPWQEIWRGTGEREKRGRRWEAVVLPADVERVRMVGGGGAVAVESVAVYAARTVWFEELFVAVQRSGHEYYHFMTGLLAGSHACCLMGCLLRDCAQPAALATPSSPELLPHTHPMPTGPPAARGESWWCLLLWTAAAECGACC